ncbi:MAG: hypothetical protein KGO96_14145 [Elusimicrobia bacterium]|nr:hypothetical protein [Elusimicrobiota bacterium]
MATKNTTSKIRGLLAACMEKAVKGDLPQEDGRNIIGLANQISQSMAVECKVHAMKLKAGQAVEAFGSLEVD